MSHGKRRFTAAAAGTFALAILLPADLDAQDLRAQCAAAISQDVQDFCENVADAARILQPRLGLAASGGNPVPGTASTLGMRIGSMPRFSLGVRVSAANADLPPVENQTVDNDVGFPVGSLSADLSVGLYEGLNLLPTVGGFASVDLLASVGVLPLSFGEGFDDTSAFTWALGARLGLLRESFTAPGVSVSAMYRQLGDVTYGDATLTDRDAFLRFDDYAVTSVRATVGKRLFGFGLTAGAGYDRYSSDVVGSVRDGQPADENRLVDLRQDGMTQSRTSLFGNASFTLLILNMAAELGWQQGADDDGKLGEGGLFGGLAVRLAI